MLNNQKNITTLAVILIIILGFSVYTNSLTGQFIWDDDFWVKNNIYLKDWSRVTEVFTKDVGAGADEKYQFYRPLQMVTYMIDYSLWQLDVKGYHLTNILLHILVALAIYWLVNILFAERLVSLLTGVLFVVFPIHTEAITYISGRADPLVSLFMLLCFILYIKHSHKKNITIYTFMLLSYVLALLSRENSLILPALLLLYHYTFKKKVEIKKFLSILSIAFIYILLRVTVLRFSFAHPSRLTTCFQRIPGFFVAITNYLRLMILPFDLHMEYGYKLFNLNDPKAMTGILLLSSLLIFAFKKRNSNRLIFFSICWFFIALLPVANIYPLGFYMAEHYLYLPSIGFLLILAKGLSYLYRKKELRILAIGLMISLLAFYSYLTIRQNKYWREPIAFYERNLRYTPDSVRILNNLANTYHNIGKDEKAVALYKKAIQTKPSYASAYNNLANLYCNMGKIEEAISLYKQAIAIKPDYAKAYANLAQTYQDMGKTEQAIALYKKAIQVKPDFVDVYNTLGGLYISIGKTEEAITMFEQAMQTNPNYPKPYYNLGVLCSEMGLQEEAIRLFEQAIELDPNYTKAYNKLKCLK